MKILITLLTAAIAMAPAAYADTPSKEQVYQAYLEEITSNGVVVGNPKRVIELGEITCYNVRHGVSLRSVMFGQFGSYGPGVAATITSAAQHQLCPDTLGGEPES